jgi:HSP20 family protein
MLATCQRCSVPLEIKESENAFSIHLELPGSSRDDIKVWHENGILTITGEKKAPEGERLVSERAFGKFERSFRLPNTVAVDKIEANYENGVVIVEIPKLEAAKPREIKLN